MSDDNLELVKRFMHMCYDQDPMSHKSWYSLFDSFDDVWDHIECEFQRRCPEPDWEQRCRDRGFIEFAPYNKEVIELKLTIMGY